MIIIKRVVTIFISLIILLIGYQYWSTYNDELCLIDRENIELKGTVELETFAGPPNYESIEKGDQELKYWILTTKDPVNCAYRYSIEQEQLVDRKGSYKRFQLVDGDNKLLTEAQESGKEVSFVGELMSSHTGYHQTDFLLFVKDNKLASK